MKKLLQSLVFALALSSQAFAAPSYSDKALLSSDPTFQNRVKASLASACVSIANEAVSAGTIQIHLKRANFCALVLASPDGYKGIFALVVANDASVIGDATQSGAVILTGGNTAAQAQLVTDGHIDVPIAASLNAYLQFP